MNITSAKYVNDFRTNENISITIVCDGETISVPIASENRHYAEIMRQVEAGTLTIQEAE
jgi:hypothetical protein